MSKNESEVIDKALADPVVQAALEVNAAKAEPAPPPPTSALEFLTSAGREPIRIWEVKGPKNVPGLKIAAILCQDNNEVVVSHTLASGKFSLFVKAATRWSWA